MHLIVPTLILIGAVMTDLRTQKVFNWYIIASFLVAAANTIWFFDTPALTQGLLGLGLAAIMTLPLFMARVLGGGDVKLLFVFGFATSYETVLAVFIGSFIWAALIGLIYSFLKGTFKILALNTIALLKGEKSDQIHFHKLPYTVALLIAWLTHLTIRQTGGALW